MLDVLIRIPNGSAKTSGSCFVLPVVAIENWDAVAVCCAVKVPLSGHMSQRLLWGPMQNKST